ncbi:MAG: ABC transporter permease [Acidimicrobiia bacterium]
MTPLRLSLRNVRQRKSRLVMMLLSIVLGVGLVTGTSLLGATIGRSFDELFATANKNTDAYVRSVEVVAGERSTRPPLPGSLLGTVRAVNGVAQAEGTVSATVTVIDKDGKALPSGGTSTFAMNWTANPLNPFTLSTGRVPSAAGEIVLDAKTADDGKFAIGDRIKLQSSVGTDTFTIVGTARFGSADGLGAARSVFLTTAEAQRVANLGDRYDAIVVKTSDGVSQAQLRDRIAPALTAAQEVLTGKAITNENQTDIRKAISGFTTFIAVFGYIALFVGTFIIYNTFSVLVTQRLRETAMLRAIGATRRQVLAMLLGEAAVAGVVAGAIGAGFGVVVSLGLQGLFRIFGLDLPTAGIIVAPGVVLTAVAKGLVVSVSSAWGPARRASKLPPIAALRDADTNSAPVSRWRIGFGMLATLAAAETIARGIDASGGSGVARVSFGFAIATVALITLMPLLARPAARTLGLAVAATRAVPGRLARDNAARNPRRTAATALAMTIGVAVVSSVLVMAASSKASIAAVVDNQLKADLVVATDGTQGVPPATARRIAELPGVRTASGLSFGAMDVGGSTKAYAAVDAATIDEVYTVPVSKGRLSDLTDDSVAVSDTIARQRSLTIGSTVDATLVDGRLAHLRVVALFDDRATQGFSWIVSRSLERTANPASTDAEVYVRLADSSAAATATVTKAVETLLADFPTAKVQDRAVYKRDQLAQIDQIVALIYVLLALTVVIALLGIANTIALSTIERRREIGLLRAIGMSRRQVRSAVRLEAVIIAVIGTLVGIVMGLGLGAAILRPLASIGITEQAVPMAQLIGVAVVGGLAGVLAAARPAAKAAGLDILTAIAS